MPERKYLAAAGHLNLVASIWTSDADQQIVFTTQIRRDLPFAFAAVLAAYQNIHKPKVLPPVPTKMARDTDDNILFIAAITANDNVRVFSQSLDRGFGLVFK